MTGAVPPFDVGMEGAGEVVYVAENASGTEDRSFRIGDAVMYISGLRTGPCGSFAEYTKLPAKAVFPIPELDPGYLPLLISGATASLSLATLGELKSGENVLVTAAAGGTGQFAVQLAHRAGCKVIGMCSTEEKMDLLHRLGCHRPINYKKEDLKSVLSKEYPRGIDVVYESVGGRVFDTCMKSLAVRGRVIVIGSISSYQNESIAAKPTLSLPMMLLTKSASLRGFFLPQYARELRGEIAKLVELYSSRQIHCEIDNGARMGRSPFKGLESVVEAVEYLYTQRSIGKVVVELCDSSNSKL